MKYKGEDSFLSSQLNLSSKLPTYLFLSFLMIAVLLSQQSVQAVLLQGDLSTTLWNREDLSQRGETEWQNFESLRLYAGLDNLSAYVHSRISRLDDNDWDANLYQGYVDWRLTNVKFRLGRQFLPNDVGFWQMDGVRGSLYHRKLRLQLYGGSAIAPWGDERSGVAGADAQWTHAPFARTRGNVVAVFDSESLDRLIVGVQLGTLGATLMGVHITERLPFQLQGKANVDVLSRTLVSGYAYTSAGIRQARVYAEYQKETPFFPEDSIFTVFDVEPLEQIALGAELQPTRPIGLYARYARQVYEVDPLNRYRFGLRLGVLSVSAERIEDGRIEYWRTNSELRWSNETWGAGLGHHYNNYRKAPASSLETAYSFQVKAHYLLARQLQLMLRVEDNVNPDFNYNVRVLGSVQWRFRSLWEPNAEQETAP